jgi:hypothetical protein
MVDTFNSLQQDFDVLILECFGSGINVIINTEFVHDAVIILTKK